MERESVRLGKLAIAAALVIALWAVALTRADTPHRRRQPNPPLILSKES